MAFTWWAHQVCVRLQHTEAACGYRSAQIMIGPNDKADANVLEVLRRSGIVIGGDDHDWMPAVPLLHECIDLCRV
jgi:hypothetical protein